MADRERWRISTDRLELVQLLAQDVQALADGHPERVETLLGASFPVPFQPPPLMDDAIPFIAGWLLDHPSDSWWQPWFFKVRELAVIAGSAGFSGPSESGALQLGYAVYPAYQGRGYATEVGEALITAAWTDQRISSVQATIPPWNTESIRVAEKLGMRAVGEGQDDEVGTIVIYEITRR